MNSRRWYRSVVKARFLAILVGSVLAVPVLALAQDARQPQPWARLTYGVVPDFFRLPPGGNFGEASGVAVDGKGHILVFNRGPQPLMEFDKNGKFLRTIGAGLFDSSHGLRIDAGGNLWTTDVGSHVVLKLSPAGRVLMVLGRKGYAGDTPELFNKPTDVAFSAAGDIFVSDGYGNNRVVKFDRNGKFVKAWGKKGAGPGDFDLPHAIVVDAKDRVYVADRTNKRIQIFDFEGRVIGQWSHVGTPWGLYITGDKETNQKLFMSDGNANRVLQLDLDGKVIGSFGGPGRMPGELSFAHALAVTPTGDIYVSEILNWRVQKFARTGPAAAGR
jgi:DNA-binding beta-propeller fold protein YncE